MLSEIIKQDQQWSVAINQCAADWADPVMQFLSRTVVWVPFYVLLIGLILYAYRKTAWIVLLGVVLLVALSDWTSVHFFKNVFMRFRPSRDPILSEIVRLPAGRGSLYGFISSHASNCFAIAAYVTMALKKRFPVFRYGILFLWAACIAYSRVYLGRHYLGDIICGCLWGLFLAWGVWKLTRSVLSKVYPSMPPFLYRPPKK